MIKELSARPWTSEHMRALIGVSDAVCLVRMNPSNYSDIRMFCRDSMTMEARPEVLSTGLTCYFDGYPIYVDKSVLRGVSVSVAKDGSDIAHMVSYRDEEPTYVHSGPFQTCSDERCVLHSVMRT